MIRRLLVVLAAFAVGVVALHPVGEALTYGFEGFPVDADLEGVLRIVSATGAIVLIVVGAAIGAAVRGRPRGWPVVAAGVLVAVLLAAYAPLDVDSALVELHPLMRLVAALVGGIVLGATAVAVLPAAPGGGDAWPVAAFAAGALATIPFVPDFLPSLPDLRQLGWAQIAAPLLAAAAAIVVRPDDDARTPGIAAVARVAIVGALAGAAFHMEYVGRATDGSPAVVVALVLLLDLALWAGLVWALVRWSGRTVGADAARFALTCAGAAAAMFIASGRGTGMMWSFGWIPLLVAGAAVVGVLLARHRSAVPWDAAGLAVTALVALVSMTVRLEDPTLAVVGGAAAAFTFGAALARTAVAGALCGLLSVLLTLPVLISVVTQLGRLLMTDESTYETPGTGRMALLYAPIWLGALVTAALLARRPRQHPPATTAAPEPLAVG